MKKVFLQMGLMHTKTGFTQNAIKAADMLVRAALLEKALMETQVVYKIWYIRKPDGEYKFYEAEKNPNL